MVNSWNTLRRDVMRHNAGLNRGQTPAELDRSMPCRPPDGSPGPLSLPHASIIGRLPSAEVGSFSTEPSAATQGLNENASVLRDLVKRLKTEA